MPSIDPFLLSTRPYNGRWIQVCRRTELERLTKSLIVTVVCAISIAPAVEAQDWRQREFPLAPTNSTGNFVAPYFDGFYQNEDGTYTLSFGFMNRNDSELIEIELGANNFIEPAEYDGVQPTSFPTVRYSGFGGPRERGVFAVVVPEDFEGDVWWTLRTEGYETKVPGRLVSPGQIITGAYELSSGPMAAGSLRPTIHWTQDDPGAWGINGTWKPETLTTTVGEPVDLSFWARDRGERELGTINVSLWKYRGPIGGEISFESMVEALPDARPPRRGGRAPGPGPLLTRQTVKLPLEGPHADHGRFTATFDTPGEYIIRVKVDSFGLTDSAPGHQCCWSNGYIRVSVTEQ